MDDPHSEQFSASTTLNSLIYVVQSWPLTPKKIIVRLEGVQARATKLSPSIKHVGDQKRLKAVSLFSLETWALDLQNFVSCRRYDIPDAFLTTILDHGLRTR